MSPYLIIFVTFLVGGLPLILYSAASIRKIGFGYWLLSPMPIYVFAFHVAFVLRPILSEWLGIRYPFTTNDYDHFFQAQLISALSTYPFLLGYSLVAARRLPRSPEERAALAFAQEPAGIQTRTIETAALALSVAMELIYLLFLLRAGAVSANLGQNRTIYLDLVIGAGYIPLFNVAGTCLLIIGLSLSVWTRRVETLGRLALVMFMFANVVVTNRSVVTSMVVMLLFVYFSRRVRENRRIAPAKIAAACAIGLVIGVSLGQLRGVDDSPAAEAVPMPDALRPVAFLALTFDMSEMFQETLNNVDTYHYGSTVFEDIFYTYLPRFAFPNKPTIYGTTRLEVEVAPSLSPESGSFNATFPIGIYAEGYANFGVPGTFLFLFVTGALLKLFYSNYMGMILDTRVNYASIYFLLMYVLLCGNSLGYLRGLGQFLSALMFTTLLLGVMAALILMASMAVQAASVSLPAKTKGAGTS